MKLGDLYRMFQFRPVCPSCRGLEKLWPVDAIPKPCRRHEPEYQRRLINWIETGDPERGVTE